MSDEETSDSSSVSEVAAPLTQTYYGETNVTTNETVLIWTIKNAFKLYDDIGYSCTSPTFTVLLNNTITNWNLEYYPNGNGLSGMENNDCEPTLSPWSSLSLCEVPRSKTKKFLYVKISAIDSNNKEYLCFRGFNRDSYSVMNEINVHKFFSINEFALHGNLKIICKMYNDPAYNNNDQSNISRSIESNLPSHVGDFEKLLNNSKHSDVILKIQDQEFFAHKAILSARSRVFEAMFEHTMKESTDNVILIIDIDASILLELLRFIYIGKVNSLRDIADKLLIAADKYEVIALKIMCENVLIERLSVETVGDILILTDLYDAKRLREAAIDFVSINASRLLDDENFNETLEKLSHLFLRTIMKKCFLHKTT